MGLKLYLSKIAKKWETEDRFTNKFGQHSLAYHRYFEGYTEVAEGKTRAFQKISRIYTGKYYRQNLSAEKQILNRVIYAVLIISAIIMYILAATATETINFTWYITVFQAGAAPFLFWSLVTFVSYLPANKDMKIAQYRNSCVHLKIATLISAIFLLLAALSTVVFVAINGIGQVSSLLYAAEFLSAGFFMLGVYITENKIQYLVIPNTIENIEEGVEIS